MQHLITPLIYNLFPLLTGYLDQWHQHTARAAALGFNWVYLNPISEPGVSKSLYSVKNYYRLNSAFLPNNSADVSLEHLRPFIRSCREFGIHPMVDLVINHTAVDSPLVAEHPAWYVRNEHGRLQHPFAVDPNNPKKKTVWKDLAEIDNLASSKREELWNYWVNLVECYVELGFEGFRCDAAYKVPSELWRFLIGHVHRHHPHIVFWAENLGCTVEQTRTLRDAGFQFFCNSSKWWNFQDTWCLDQHREFEDMLSISFPETHDTERLAKESGGNAAIQRQRYAFAATFSAGVMLPIGYEFGFQNRLHVVETCPDDWEPARFNLDAFVRAINQFKIETPLFQGEGSLVQIQITIPHLLIVERRSQAAPGQRGWIVVHTHRSLPLELSSTILPVEHEHLFVIRLSWLDQMAEAVPFGTSLMLKPSEVVAVLDNRPVG